MAPFSEHHHLFEHTQGLSQKCIKCSTFQLQTKTEKYYSGVLHTFGLVEHISRAVLNVFVVFRLPLQRVSEGALSPDGTVLATASHDGYIKFWQIYIEGGQDQPR